MKAWIVLTLISGCLSANPSHLSVEAGRALARERGETLEIETSDTSVLNWETFSIQDHETTRFLQPSASSSVLNRVTGSDISRLLGRLEANGKIYLINPNGIVIGKDAVINTAAFLASTLQIESEEFLQGGEIHLKGSSLGQIENLGMISSASGPVCLLAHKVENRGTMTGPHVSLGAGCEFIVQPSGETQLFVRTGSDSSLLNEGTIQALVAELQSDGVEGLAINHKGIIQANRVTQEGGRVFLRAAQGTTEISGEIHAPGGTVQALGERVHLVDAAKIDVSCANGGGSILVGGDVHGDNSEVQNAKLVMSGPNTYLCADALEQGNGGKIVLWGDEANLHYGTVSAQGGPLGGDGGFVEISAPQLEFCGKVDTLAPLGKTGTLLLDPTNVVINDPVTTTGSWSSCSPPIDYNFVVGTQPNLISAADLVTQLGTCNVLIDTTTSAGANTGSITISTPISWGGANSLTLNAAGDIAINADITTVGGDFTCQTDEDIQFGSLSLTTTTGTMNFNSRNINIPSSIQFSSSGSGTANLTATKDITITGQINSFFVVSAMNVNFSAGETLLLANHVYTQGADYQFAATGDILVSALIQMHTVSGTFSFQAGGDITLYTSLQIESDTPGESLNFSAGGNFTTEQQFVSQSFNTTFTAGQDISLSGDSSNVNGNLTYLAGESFFVSSAATISDATNITIVADNNHPSSIGSGIIDIASNASISTNAFIPGGKVAIYATIPEVNFFPATINGGAVTADQVTCDVYYPGGVVGSPFSIFFKACPSGILLNIPTGLQASLASILQYNAPSQNKKLTQTNKNINNATSAPCQGR